MMPATVRPLPRQAKYTWRAEVHHEVLPLRHLLDGMAQTLPPHPGIFPAAVGRVVDSKARNILDDDSANFQLYAGSEDGPSIIGEDPCPASVRLPTPMKKRPPKSRSFSEVVTLSK